jgi:hypothetical protein
LSYGTAPDAILNQNKTLSDSLFTIAQSFGATYFEVLAVLFCKLQMRLLFLSQSVNTATSSPADDAHHYVIPLKLLLTNKFYFQQTSGIHAPVGKRKGCSLSGRSPVPIADSFNVATMARKHSVLHLREINRNNKHTALASV